MSKQLEFSQTARSKLNKGAQTVISAVKTTLGPCGRNVAFFDKSSYSVVVTKDGVTAAKEVSLEDPYENLGASLIKEVPTRSNDDVGDGTTSSSVLAGAILDEGMKVVSSGANPIFLKRGLDKAASLVIDEIKKISKEISSPEDVKNIAAISANNDPEMGQLVADAVEKVGKDGSITVDESKGMSSTVRLSEGLEIDEGYISPYFVSNDDTKINYDNPFILICEKSITSARDIIPILEKVSHTQRPLVVLSENVDGEALSTLVYNNMRGALKVCAVKLPGFGDYRRDIMNDIAVITGASVISDEYGTKLETAGLDLLGSCKSVKIKKNSTIFIGGSGTEDAINQRKEQINNQLKDKSNENEPLTDIDKKRLKERLAKLSGGIAVIELGAATETELKEKRYRMDDTLAATKAAIEEGIVPGGGTTLIYAANKALTDKVINKVEDETEKLGFKILKKAVERPLWQIAENAGVSGDVIVNAVKTQLAEQSSFSFGYNAKTGEYGDLLEMGVVDPAKVTKCVIKNATSVAGIILTTECAIVDKPETTNCCNNQNNINPLM